MQTTLKLKEKNSTKNYTDDNLIIVLNFQKLYKHKQLGTYNKLFKMIII